MLAFIYVLFCTSYSFTLIIVWWVWLIWWRRIWWTWVIIRVSWYVRYQIGWIFAWLRISFRCHAFWWLFMWWWQKFTCTPIWTYWWSLYQRIYRCCQYFSIAQILSESWIYPMFVEYYGVVLIDLVWFGSTWIKSEYFCFRFIIKSMWFQFTENLRPTFLTSEFFLGSVFLKFCCL